MFEGADFLLANGFLPTRGSWMLDFVSCAMVFVVLALTYSIYQVRVKKNHALHRKIQMATVCVLAIALLAFEIDIRFYTDWKKLAEPSPFFESKVVENALFVHLCFAIPTPVLWLVVIASAVRGFKTGFDQGEFNRFHRITGRTAAVFMICTAISGWIFYYLAFIA